MADSDTGNNTELSAREQDRFFPIANVSRIMKKALPTNAKISKDAKETTQECVSEFISFITGEVFDKCEREKQETINGDDLLWAMTTLGFEEYVEPLKVYLAKYREMEGKKTTMAGRQGENDGSDGGDVRNSGGGFSDYGGMHGSNIMMGRVQQHQHRYNSGLDSGSGSSYHQTDNLGRSDNFGGGSW